MGAADGVQYLYDFRTGSMHLAKLVWSIKYQWYQLGVTRNREESLNTVYAKPLL